jgi:cytochrome c oxidase assembly protein subunit 15
MQLSEFKHIFFWEYFHRMVGRTMMYVFAIGLIILIIRKKINKQMLPSLNLIVFYGSDASRYWLVDGI